MSHVKQKSHKTIKYIQYTLGSAPVGSVYVSLGALGLGRRSLTNDGFHQSFSYLRWRQRASSSSPSVHLRFLLLKVIRSEVASRHAH